MVNRFKTEIFPDENQHKLFLCFCNEYRDMWNYTVEKFRDNYPVVCKNGIKGFRASDLFKESKNKCLQRIAVGVIKNYAFAVKMFKLGICNKPRFHKYNPNKQSFYLACHKLEIVRLSEDEVIIGRKGVFRWIRLDVEVINKYDIKEIREPVFSYENGRWYISGAYRVETAPRQGRTEFIGLDWGIKNFMTTSDGQFINYPKSIKREYQRVKILLKHLNEKQKGSRNYIKMIRKCHKAIRRIEHLKHDFIEQETTRLCRQNNIAVEKFPPTTYKRFKYVERVAPRGRFVIRLARKCEKFGTEFMAVPPQYTSRICSCCGFQKKSLKLSERIYKCENCGVEIDRDVNAARNIAAMGVRSIHKPIE